MHLFILPGYYVHFEIPVCMIGSALTLCLRSLSLKLNVLTFISSITTTIETYNYNLKSRADRYSISLGYYFNTIIVQNITSFFDQYVLRFRLCVYERERQREIERDRERDSACVNMLVVSVYVNSFLYHLISVDLTYRD